MDGSSRLLSSLVYRLDAKGRDEAHGLDVVPHGRQRGVLERHAPAETNPNLGAAQRSAARSRAINRANKPSTQAKRGKHRRQTWSKSRAHARKSYCFRRTCIARKKRCNHGGAGFIVAFPSAGQHCSKPLLNMTHDVVHARGPEHVGPELCDVVGHGLGAHFCRGLRSRRRRKRRRRKILRRRKRRRRGLNGAKKNGSKRNPWASLVWTLNRPHTYFCPFA